mmetsp:Transcript_59178/g.97966  ORF Transcript_59178/g.97966 Transcript_59178/m.97966 type:complete len:388 (-) Transcript_59178:422-1585(-)|eukprot:CAMPEP_0119300968 /NCGR_PEP_ID=MMETSP1333-20130426/2849_1 /TAXON_ID=418940 /ORGANISM="Scyphosphaera apsteinii, Strain RCC1455" /LENGTH=387 /DNA_ID=CAMNT_0007302921 /DNA_START=79 /DNA_END=1242 /DNA_ORIENTATION=-
MAQDGFSLAQEKLRIAQEKARSAQERARAARQKANNLASLVHQVAGLAKNAQPAASPKTQEAQKPNEEALIRQDGNAVMSDSLEQSLISQSIGLATKEEVKRRREELEEETTLRQLREANAHTAVTSDSGTSPHPSDAMPKKKKTKKKAATTNCSSTLSFGDEMAEEEEATSAFLRDKLIKSGCEAAEVAKQQASTLRAVRAERERLHEEPITLQYAIRNEATERGLPTGVYEGSVEVTRGLTVEMVAHRINDEATQDEAYAAAVRRWALRVPRKKWNESSSYAGKRDLVLVCRSAANGTESSLSYLVPGSMKLIDVMSKRWDSGALMFDDLKSGIIVSERYWYTQRQHTFPYSQWEALDLDKTYSFKEAIANRHKLLIAKSSKYYS